MSLAMLRQDWDKESRSFVDKFEPFIADCLRDAGAKGMSDGDLRECVVERFGITIPLTVLQTLLRRLRRSDLATTDNDGINKPTPGLSKRPSLGPERSAGRRRIGALISKLCDFADRHGESWTPEEAEAALQTYVEEWHRPLALMRAEYRGEALQPELVTDAASEYLVASFVLELRDTDPDTFGWVLDVIKASMTTAGLYLDLGRLDQRFSDRTTAYFDTPDLLDLLVGAEDSRVAVQELLDLCTDMNVSLACFDHTAREMRLVLEAGAQAMRAGRSGSNERPAAQAWHERLSASDLEDISTTLKQRLRQHGIEVRRKPVWNGAATTDEQALDELLQEVVDYRRDNTRERDVDSILAVHRIRLGEEPIRFEDAKAFLVTSNRKVARASAKHFGTYQLAGSVPVVVTLQEFGTLLWLKCPTDRPDLPWKQLLADCRAAVRPSPALWSHYLDEVEHLRDAGKIDAEMYFMARYSTEARRTLMEKTKGDDKRVSAKTVVETLEEAKSAVAAPAVAEAEARRLEAEQRAKLLEKQAAAAQADRAVAETNGFRRGRQEGRAEGNEEAAERISRLFARAIGALVALTFAGLVLLPPSLDSLLLDAFNLEPSSWFLTGRRALFVIISGVFVWVTAFGGSIRDRVAVRLQPHVRLWIDKNQEVTMEGRDR